MEKILIDTDVILDFFFDRMPFAENASRVLSLCESKKVMGYITPVILSNVYYLLRQTAKHEKVIEKLTLLVSFTEILIIDKHTVIKALKSDFKDFEDALQNYAAETGKEINAIISRNIKDYKNSTIAVMTPDSYLRIRYSAGI